MWSEFFAFHVYKLSLLILWGASAAAPQCFSYKAQALAEKCQNDQATDLFPLCRGKNFYSQPLDTVQTVLGQYGCRKFSCPAKNPSPLGILPIFKQSLIVKYFCCAGRDKFPVQIGHQFKDGIRAADNFKEPALHQHRLHQSILLRFPAVQFHRLKPMRFEIGQHMFKESLLQPFPCGPAGKHKVPQRGSFCVGNFKYRKAYQPIIPISVVHLDTETLVFYG